MTKRYSDGYTDPAPTRAGKRAARVPGMIQQTHQASAMRLSKLAHDLAVMENVTRGAAKREYDHLLRMIDAHWKAADRIEQHRHNAPVSNQEKRAYSHVKSCSKARCAKCSAIAKLYPYGPRP